MRTRWREPQPRNGADGRDAEVVDVEQVVKDLLARQPRPRNGRDADPQQIAREVDQAVARVRVPEAKDGERGPRGFEGPPGPPGPKPKHEWRDTELRFERPDGTWGKYVDLRGPQGFGGGVVQVGTSAPPFDLDSLPVGDTSTPEEVVVKQHGVWVRIGWADFVALVGVPIVPLDLSLDGDPLSLDGEQLSLT